FVEILRVGAPMSLQPILNNLALATLTSFVGSLGAAQLAGFGAAVRLEYLLYPLAFRLGAGVIAMVGTRIGAGTCARAECVAWTAAAVAAAVTGCIGLFGATSPDTWVSLFSNVQEIHVLAAGYLVISCVAYPFLGLGLTLASAFQAAGRPMWPLFAITSHALVVAVGGWGCGHINWAGLERRRRGRCLRLDCLRCHSGDRFPCWRLENPAGAGKRACEKAQLSCRFTAFQSENDHYPALKLQGFKNR